MDSQETYLLLLLSDSNLPTGSFVASSGLESYLKHGFGAAPSSSQITPSSSSSKLDAIATFVRDSLATYAPSALPFVSDAHAVTSQLLRGGADADEPHTLTLAALARLDALYQCMTLNHVARRASAAQGVALLSLYTKGFVRPRGLSQASSVPETVDDEKMLALVDAFKRMVRRGGGEDDGTYGHLPVCWGVLCGALGLSLDRTQHLHLYLHARALLSAAVRLNAIGPYAAQQLLLHAVGGLVDAEFRKCARLRTGILHDEDDSNPSASWDDTRNGPANTWPLGEILAARHDLQHSRIFNS